MQFRTSDLGKHRLDITLFCPPGAADRLENEITLELLRLLRTEAAVTPAETATGAAPEAKAP